MKSTKSIKVLLNFILLLLLQTGRIRKSRKSGSEGNSSGNQQVWIELVLCSISTTSHSVNIWKGKHSVTSIFDPYTWLYQPSSLLLYFKGRRILSSETCAQKSASPVFCLYLFLSGKALFQIIAGLKSSALYSSPVSSLPPPFNSQDSWKEWSSLASSVLFLAFNSWI